jgi:tetratricopeptide (TPR) repeat protein
VRFIFILLFSFSLVWAIEIDMDFLKREVVSNPDDVKSRLILARSYMKKSRYDDAQKLLNEVLTVDKKNQKAKFLLKDISKLKQIQSLINSSKLSKTNNLTSYIDRLNNSKQHKYVILLSDVLKRNNIALNSAIEFDVIDSYISLKEYSKAKSLLSKSSLSAQDKHIMTARIYEAKGKYELAQDEYKKALESGNNDSVVLALYDSYTKHYQTKEAQALAKKYTVNSSTPVAKALKQREAGVISKQIDVLKKNYEKKSSFENLKRYYYALENRGDKSKALKVLSSHVKRYPKKEDSALFLAKLKYWAKKPKESLEVLRPIVDRTKNREILSLYAEMLVQTNNRDRALPYMKRLAKLGDTKSKIEVQKIENDALLSHAVEAHKAKDYPRAIVNYKEYYEKSKDAKIAKEIAELYFVLDQAKEALPFYDIYLKEYPDDNKMRFRYAAALDSLKQYQLAEVEYKRVAHVQDELYTLATYRYATSLIAQKDEPKWNHSRAVLQNLLSTLQSQAPSKKRNDLLKFTKATLKKVSKTMPRPTRYKDVILAEGQKKIIDNTATFSGTELIKRDISSVKSMLMPINVSVRQPQQKDVTLSFHSLKDETIDNISYGIRLNKFVKLSVGTLSLEAKRSKFQKKNIKEDVDSFMTHFNFKNLTVGMGMSKFEDFNDVLAKITYRKIFAGHDMTFGLKNLNGAFVNAQACMIDKKINIVQFSLYDAMLLSNLDQAELGLIVNSYDDGNLNVNTFVEYPIYKLRCKNFENDFSFSGSYEYNSKTERCYHPSKFFDGNYIQARPKIQLGKRGFVQGIGGIGYSFRNDDVLYNYGLSAEIAVTKNFDIRVDCRHYQSGYSADGADECYATAAYKW